MIRLLVGASPPSLREPPRLPFQPARRVRRWRNGAQTRRSLACAVAVLGAALLAGCSSTASTDTGTTPPPGELTCSSTVSASDAASAATALAAAKPGSCVGLTGSVSGALDVPSGVALFGASAATAITADGDAPGITLHEGSILTRVSIASAKKVGVAIRAANARVEKVTVSGAKTAAVAILCKETETPGCAAGAIRLRDVELTASALGLWVSGAHVLMNGGKSEGHTSTGLTGASGVVGVDGARLELDSVSVSKNQGAGVLVDGAKTTLLLKNGAVSENNERGVWAQRLEGTLDNPAVKIDGTELVKNRIVGVGALESRGIIIVGGRIANTVATPIATNLSATEDVGDGVGLFGGSGDLSVDSELDSNARAAALIDGSERGIIIVGGRITAGASGIKVVVQGKSGADVQVSSDLRSTPAAALGVSAPKLTLPSVL